MGRKAKRRQYGHGSVSKKATRDTYDIQWRTDSGKRRTEAGFATELDARKRLAEVVADMGGPARSPGDRTLNDHAVDWLEERVATHADAYGDRNRWDLHLKDSIGECRPDDVTPSTLRTFIMQKRKQVAPATVKLMFLELSSLYSDLMEGGHAKVNPCRQISKKTRALMKSEHDPKNTPFLHDMADVVRLYHQLYTKAPVVGTAYAIGALGGLRTGEVRALEWAHVDLARAMLHVQVQAGPDGPRGLKDGESRIVPIQPALLPILADWAARGGQGGLVCKPIRGGKRKFLDDHTMGTYLREAVAKLALEACCSCCAVAAAWYEYTRHTYACHYIMAGGSMEELSRSLGHSTIAITQAHYVHLQPGYYSDPGRKLLVADFHLPAEVAAAGAAAKLANGRVSTRVGTKSVQLAGKLAGNDIFKGEKTGLKMVK